MPPFTIQARARSRGRACRGLAALFLQAGARALGFAAETSFDDIVASISRDEGSAAGCRERRLRMLLAPSPMALPAQAILPTRWPARRHGGDAARRRAANEGTGTMEAAVVSLKTRSIAPEEANQRLSLQALAWLREQGRRPISCSNTARLLRLDAGRQHRPGGRGLAQPLSAPAGAGLPGLPGQRPHGLSRSSLRAGPAALRKRHGAVTRRTPMTDPDIRRWLAQADAPSDVGRL